MVRSIGGFVLIVFIVVSCKSKNKEDGGLFTLPGEWPPEDSIQQRLKEQVKSGRVEYFTINGTKFRFQKNDSNASMFDLQVQNGSAWLPNLALQLPPRHHVYSLSSDIDLDGHYDLATWYVADKQVYFFNEEEKKFDQKMVQFPEDYALLNKDSIIYGANRHGLNDWNVQIFSLQSRDKKYLYFAKLNQKENTNNGGFAITDVFLYKCENGNFADTALIEKIGINKQFADFSLLNFMKNVAKYGTARRSDQKPE